MSLVVAAPELMAQAATDLANIGSALSAAHMAAVAPTVAVIPAAADEVSAGIAHLFSQHARDYQKLAGQAAAFHEQFAQHATASAGSYANTEAANAALLQPAAAIADSSTSAVVIPLLPLDYLLFLDGLFNFLFDLSRLFLPITI